jgi:hypothetical protein
MQSAGSRTDRQITANENAAKLAQRAWIAPRGIIRDKDQIYEVGQALNIRVIYSNTGKEPAVDIDQRHEQIIVPGECSAASGCAFKTPAEPNCVGLLPISGGAIAFPASTIGENGTGGYEAIIAPEKANNGSISGYPVRITEAVHVKIAIIVARGCFAYMTDGTRHTSAYCYKFDGSRAGYDMSKWEWRPCDVGYFAD